MTTSRNPHAYVVLVGAAALGLMAVFLRADPLPVISLHHLALLMGGMGLMMVAGYCPICVGPKVAVSMAAAVIFAMLLLLPPVLVAVGTMVAIGVLYTVKRWPTLYVVFNIVQSAFTVLAVAAVMRLLGVTHPFTEFGPREVAEAGASAAVFFVVNSVVVTQFAVLNDETTFLAHWRKAFGRSAVPYLSTLLVGMVVAATYVHVPVVAPFLILPVVAIYRALRDATVVRLQTRETIEFLADIIDRRDHYTYEHSQRVASLAKRIAARMGLPDEVQDAVTQAARVHDLGKLGIRDELLYKPSRLTDHELEEIHKHSVIGAEIVGKLPEYARGKEFILFHHERYDGSGDFRLYGQHIPLGARIIAVADAFDAMTSDRAYRQALTREQALAEIAKGSGNQFDPAAASALAAIVQEDALQAEAAVEPRLAPASPLASA